MEVLRFFLIFHLLVQICIGPRVGGENPQPGDKFLVDIASEKEKKSPEHDLKKVRTNDIGDVCSTEDFLTFC